MVDKLIVENIRLLEAENLKSRLGHYSEWDGVCAQCGHSYFECRGNCTCLACNAQRQQEIESGLAFSEDVIDLPWLRGELEKLKHPTPLAKILAEKKITQVKFAEMVGVSQPTVQAHISGRTRMRSDTIKKYAEALGVDPGFLL